MAIFMLARMPCPFIKQSGKARIINQRDRPIHGGAPQANIHNT